MKNSIHNRDLSNESPTSKHDEEVRRILAGRRRGSSASSNPEEVGSLDEGNPEGYMNIVTRNL